MKKKKVDRRRPPRFSPSSLYYYVLFARSSFFYSLSFFSGCGKYPRKIKKKTIPPVYIYIYKCITRTRTRACIYSGRAREFLVFFFIRKLTELPELTRRGFVLEGKKNTFVRHFRPDGRRQPVSPAGSTPRVLYYINIIVPTR